MNDVKKTLDEQEVENEDEVLTDEGAEESPADECDEDDSKVDIDEVLAENQKLKEDFLRAYAEADNVKKRCQQEIEKNTKFAISDFAKSLLPVADNLQRAIDAVESENAEACEALRKGIELTQSELIKVFDKFHIHKMDILGKVFDPNFHQVVQEVADDTKPAGTVIAEIQSGYMIHDRILREAMVIVSK